MLRIEIIFILLVSLFGLNSQGQNKVSESQKDFYPRFIKHDNCPEPAEMLINKDSEPLVDEGFKDLYNKKNFEGWVIKGGKSKFTAKGDVIVGECVKGTPSTYLSTKKNDYKDFIFTCEIKWEVMNNTGVMFRASYINEKVTGPQVEMEGISKRNRDWSGGIYGQDCGGWFYPLWLEVHKDVRKALKADDFNRVTIMCKGDVTKTWINGLPAAHWKNTQFKQGFFGLQIHKGRSGLIQFKNIKIKEIN